MDANRPMRVSVISASLRQTQTALENFSRDPKFIKSSIVNALDCPQFPDSEWNNVIAGRAVDLDQVFTSIFSGVQGQKTHQLGDFEILDGPLLPGKSVKTHGDWNSAWDLTVEATTFLFPHRDTELRGYGQHIRRLFQASPAEAYQQVIMYDKAVRVRVSSRRDLHLTDIAEFTDLHMHWIFYGGPSSYPGPSSEPRGVKRVRRERREPCRRFNENRCPNTKEDCSRPHICSKCQSNEHSARSCARKQT